MSLKFHDKMYARHREELGALSAEYVGVLIVIGLLVAALVGLGIDRRVTERGGEAVENIFDGGGGDGEEGGED